MNDYLLAGPILRRVTRNRVCVWLATDRKVDLQLSVLDGDSNAIGKSDPNELDTSRCQLGANLFVYLLQARPAGDDPFPLDVFLHYRITQLDGEREIPFDFSGLTYGRSAYPHFFIPGAPKRLLHGSCRKPHGQDCLDSNRDDALSFGDDLLQQTHDDLDQRPALLLLTGDQIYADDVAVSLLALLRQEGVWLTGQQELLPLGESAAGAPALDPAAISLHGRMKTMRHQAGFSSGEAQNHLCTFGEFAAMYVYAFGNARGWQPAWDWNALSGAEVVENPAEAQAAFTRQLPALRRFHDTLPKIRRLLANIPTYMIFDDHDVTDDWNITGHWYDRVRSKPMGCRVVANALAAYWAFQGWGNDPDNFDKDIVLSIEQHLSKPHQDNDIAERFDLHTWKHRGWGFSVPTDPPIIAIDSRTQRQPDNPYYPPQLLDRYALDWLRVEWAKLKTGQTIDRCTCPIFITTTPVMGFAAVEGLQQALLWLVGQVESYRPVELLTGLLGVKGYLTCLMVDQLDAESWISNREGFAALLNTLLRRMGIVRCVFLSGDVHYSFTTDACFESGDETLHCRQLTSTALHNSPGDNGALLEKAGGLNGGRSHHSNWTILPGQRWKALITLVPITPGNTHVTSDCNLGMVELANGIPSIHTLLTGNQNLSYTIPPFPPRP